MGAGKRIASSVRFKLRGANELTVALKKRTDMELLQRTVQLNGSEMQRQAQRYAPVDTGFLKGSILLTSPIRDRGLTVRVFATAEYAVYQEFGTRYMYAQPFMKPAYKKQRKQFKKDLKRIMK